MRTQNRRHGTLLWEPFEERLPATMGTAGALNTHSSDTVLSLFRASGRLSVLFSVFRGMIKRVQ
jgi:hypothetical protein